MKRRIKIRISSLLIGSIIIVTIWSSHASKNKQGSGGMKTEAPVKMNIINKRVIEGSLVPHKEVEIKTQLAGILDKLYVAVGDQVTPGTVIARIKALPKSDEVVRAQKTLHLAQLDLEEAAAKYQRSKQLFEKKMLSPEKYEDQVRAWKKARKQATHAQNELDFVLKGHIAGTKGASNLITSTIDGIIAELPCKEGSVVRELSTYNEGSTIATIADMRTILFEGKVGEMEVAYLRKGMEFEVSLNAIKGKKFTTTLAKVAPKATKTEKEESIKFAIEGTVKIDPTDQASIRAGYTAMADIVLEQATDVLAIKEKCLHQETSSEPSPSTQEGVQKKEPGVFVWVYENGQKVKKSIQLGVSDGIYVEVKEGLTENDQVIVEDDSH